MEQTLQMSRNWDITDSATLSQNKLGIIYKSCDLQIAFMTIKIMEKSSTYMGLIFLSNPTNPFSSGQFSQKGQFCDGQVGFEKKNQMHYFLP